MMMLTTIFLNLMAELSCIKLYLGQQYPRAGLAR
jgi:hypothetical protein